MMQTRKNKILTMLFGLFPGAGHMFMGFMHLGVSYMVLFFGTIAVMVFLNQLSLTFFDFLGFILPVIWCYAFFDCLNKCYASDEEYYLLEDRFLFIENGSLPSFKYNFNFRLGRYARLGLGWFLTVSGVLLLLRNALLCFANSELWGWDSYFYRFIREIFDAVPRFLAALVIIIIGLWLIFGKRKELKDLKSLINMTESEDVRQPKGFRSPTGFQVSEDFKPEDFQSPEDAQVPVDLKLSEDFQPPEDVQVPVDLKLSEDFQPPEDAQAPVDLKLSEDFQSSAESQVSADADSLIDLQNPEEEQRHE